MKATTLNYLNACKQVMQVQRKLDRGENKFGGFNNPNTRYKLEEQLKKAQQKERYYENCLTKDEYEKYLESDYAMSWEEFKGIE